MGYILDLDISSEFEPDFTLYFQSLGRRAVKNGYNNQGCNAVITSNIAQSITSGGCTIHNSIPTQETLTYNPTYPKIEYSDFKECDWSEFNENTKEEIPPYAPEPSG